MARLNEPRRLQGLGHILLISCYELGHQPIGLALPLAFLEDAGFKPDALDLALEPLEDEKIKKARLIAISVPMHTALRIGIDAARRIHKINTQCQIVFFGLYASLNTKWLLKEGSDFVIGGEYETPLLNLVKSLDQGQIDSVEGVSSRAHHSEPYLKHLNFLTPQRERLLPLEKYAHLVEKNTTRTAGYVESSRGCRHHCRHCPIPPVYQGRFFLIPKQTVLEDIDHLVKMGATHITFGDPDFLNGAVHSLRIVREMHVVHPDITFDFTAKVEHLIRHESYLEELRSLGCIFIISAVESFSNKVLSCLVKGHTREEAVEVFHRVKAAGIALRPTFVVFTPWTTLQDLMDLFEIVEREGMIQYVDPVQYAIRLLIPPGSLLLSEPSLHPFLGGLDASGISYDWSHPDPRMDSLQKRFSRLIESEAESHETPEPLFYQLKEYIHAEIEQREARDIEIHPEHTGFVPPKLSESWFCCAEPTEKQLCIEEIKGKPAP